MNFEPGKLEAISEKTASEGFQFEQPADWAESSPGMIEDEFAITVVAGTDPLI